MALWEGPGGGSLSFSAFEPEFVRPAPPQLPVPGVCMLLCMLLSYDVLRLLVTISSSKSSSRAPSTSAVYAGTC
jgi:hypothetical protein